MSHVSGGTDAGAEPYIAAVDATHAAFPDLVVTVHDQVAEHDQEGPTMLHVIQDPELL